MRWLLCGAFWIADDGRALDVLDRASGARLRIDGALREAVLAGRHGDARLAALGRVDAEARALVAALVASPPRRLTRADVLRGSGYAQLFIELTGQCNERCQHCYADAAPERGERLSLAAIERAIDDAAALGFQTVQLTGGDPLLHPNVVDAAAYARARAIPTLEIYTNGLLLGSSLLERLMPWRPQFAFSVYSDDASVHDAVTGVAGSHARTYRAIRACLQRGLRVRVGVTLFEHTAARREAIRASLRELGVDERAIAFGTSRAVGRGQAYDVRDEGGSHGLDAGRDAGKACVAYDGNVYPCIFSRHMTLGNVYRQSLRSALEQDVPVEIDTGELDRRAADAAERLSCLDCRARDAMLGAAKSASRLVQLSSAR